MGRGYDLYLDYPNPLISMSIQMYKESLLAWSLNGLFSPLASEVLRSLDCLDCCC